MAHSLNAVIKIPPNYDRSS